MDAEEKARRLEAVDRLLALGRDAYREWRTAYEVEARAAFLSLDEATRMKVTFHVFRMLATDVGSYRYLIYDKLGFGMDAYAVLFDGLRVNNALHEDDTRAVPRAVESDDPRSAEVALDEHRREGGVSAEEWFGKAKRKRRR